MQTAVCLKADPRYAPNLTSWVAAAGMAGKPLAITEWNMGKHPSHERAALPAYFAAIASFQDWNAPMEYAYSQSPLGKPGRLTNWEMANDPALLAMMPVGALIFRQQHVRPGTSINYLRPTAADFIDTALSPVTSRAIRTLDRNNALAAGIAGPQGTGLVQASSTRAGRKSGHRHGGGFFRRRRHDMCRDGRFLP